MISVGIDVSKEKSTICVLKPYGEIVMKPKDVQHTESELSKLVGELQELQEKGMQFQQDASQQLQQSWMEMLQPIAQKIDDAIKAVGQEGGYVYIFDLSSTNIPYVSTTLSTDVTTAVKGKLGLQ